MYSRSTRISYSGTAKRIMIRTRVSQRNMPDTLKGISYQDCRKILNKGVLVHSNKMKQQS